MDGTPSLLIAAMKGYKECVEILIENGAALDTARAQDGFNPLLAAVWGGNTDCAETLIKHGADLNTPRTKDGTPRCTWQLKRAIPSA
ncbi:ankyrin repeat domain-containing protein [Endozoicomonas sp. ALC020]|uniref:ankyrin repeat domain-containing protein n=1 Tax=unclassified Endozoicomonas TaxID=2644528 RepID=UPI003BB0864D